MPTPQPVRACPTCGSRRRCGHRARQNTPSRPRDYRGTAEYRRVRARVLERDGYACHLAIPDVCTGTADTLDHSPVPYSALPHDAAGNVPLELALDETNLRAACAACNRVQSNRHLEGL